MGIFQPHSIEAFSEAAAAINTFVRPLKITMNGTDYGSIEEFINSLVTPPYEARRVKTLGIKIGLQAYKAADSLLGNLRLFIVFKQTAPTYTSDTTGKSLSELLDIVEASAIIDLGDIGISAIKGWSGHTSLYFNRNFSYTYSKKLKGKVGMSDEHLENAEHRTYLMLGGEFYSSTSGVVLNILGRAHFTIDLLEVKLTNSLL